MKTYRVLWLRVCVPLGATGAAVGIVNSPDALASMFILFGAVGSLLTLCLVDDFWRRSTGGRMRLLAVGALAAGTGVSASFGYASLVGLWVLPVAAAILASSPSAVKACGRCFRSVRNPPTTQSGALARAYANPESTRFRTPPELRELTVEHLCQRWRASYEACPRQPSAVQLISTVEERHAYLDELERRNASGFAAWLASGPQTAGDPLPYLTADHIDVPALDWDQLTRGHGS